MKLKNTLTAITLAASAMFAGTAAAAPTTASAVTADPIGSPSGNVDRPSCYAGTTWWTKRSHYLYNDNGRGVFRTSKTRWYYGSQVDVITDCLTGKPVTMSNPKYLGTTERCQNGQRPTTFVRGYFFLYSYDRYTKDPRWIPMCSFTKNLPAQW